MRNEEWGMRNELELIMLVVVIGRVLTLNFQLSTFNFYKYGIYSTADC